jgi:photosystem II stability/assembly factor-like uncharacterized protein
MKDRFVETSVARRHFGRAAMPSVRNMFRRRTKLAAIVALALSSIVGFARPAATQTASAPSDAERPVVFDALAYRLIGPFRGGRSAAVEGVPGDPTRYYFGACGGGVWTTDDAGSTWRNISDGYFGGSIGAVAVAPSDPNVIYVGGGEVTVRGNVSHGDGVWKSLDAGRTWQHMGLDDSRCIPRIRVHPTDPNTVYVAALGHLFGPNVERGVFRSRDGGQTWSKILFVSDEAGAVDLILDPNNPRVLYAAMWKVRRTPYSLGSGGEGSGLWTSTDGGDTWQEITRRPGLPQGTVGIIGITVSPVNSNRLWAIVEAEDGGVFRSDDRGNNWTRTNEERELRQRAWYYSRIYAGPTNIDEVYVLNVGFFRSRDGGSTFASIDTPHSDHHDLWIDPSDARRMIVADDGGAQVSFNGGDTWSTYLNQPTAQFYRVTTDNHVPYRIYGAQQDNSTVRISHRSDGSAITEDDWEDTAGGESGFLAPDPNDPDIVYGGSYGGFLERVNHRTREVRDVQVWPDNPIGRGADDLKYRFQWNFPILFSPIDPTTLYAAGNVLFKTQDGGQSWTAISPDLTRNDPTKLGPSGGPITKDNTSVEYYCTIFAVAASHHDGNVIWCGSDDGLVHVTRDGGANWTNVTPPDLPEWAMINSLEVHPTEPGGLYLAATRYKLDDFRPYLFKTTDYGQTWTPINNGIDRRHFTRVVRADPGRAGLLYAGTENGMYVSFDDGQAWQPFQLNLPIVPITDLAIKNGDLIVATQGRSFWVLDDLSLLHQWQPEITQAPAHFFQSRPTFRMRGRSSGRATATAGQNAPGGVVLRYHLAKAPTSEQTVAIEISDPSGQLIHRWSTEPAPGSRERKLDVSAGMNRLDWDLRHPGAETFPGNVLWGGGTQGPRAVPGMYQARLIVGDQTLTMDFEIQKDPRCAATDEDFRMQFDFLASSRDKLTEIHRSIRKLRDVRDQLKVWRGRLEKDEAYKSLVESIDATVGKLDEIENQLYQTRMQSSQDPLNFPIRLNNRLSALVSAVDTGDNRPTQQSVAFRDELFGLVDEQLASLDQVFREDLNAINAAILQQQIPAVIVNEPEPLESSRSRGGSGDE